MPHEHTITQLLDAIKEGDGEAHEQLWASVYGELHRIARVRMLAESRESTIQATALVHEAYLRIFGSTDISFENRGHFFSAAASAMRRICVDYARKRKADKRGNGRQPALLDFEPPMNGVDVNQMLDLHDALTQLECERPDLARLVELRFFAGLTVDETAEVLNVAPRTVDNRWRLARSWLDRALTGESERSQE